MEYNFRCRWYQRPFHEAFLAQKVQRFIAIAHRRWGKDEVVLAGTRELLHRRVGSYWHCLPEFAQCRKALWTAVNPHTGKKRIEEAFPLELRASTNNQEMFIEFKNGSTWQMIGSDRYDATVGAGVAGITYSEWALANPAAWGYHRPMLMENNGWAAFITTPRGNNHCKAMYDMAVKSPAWFAELSSIEMTKALTEDQLSESLAEYRALYGDALGQAMFEQEYHCSFIGAMVGAYFGSEMTKAEKAGRITEVPIDTKHPVHCVMDLGKTENNPVWLFQVIDGSLRVVDFYQPATDDLDDWCSDLRARGWNGITYVPHDIMVTEWGSKKTRIERLRDRKMNPRRITRVSVADGLQAGRMAINAATFDAVKCEIGIDGLKAYRREWDSEMKTFRENPVKDWSEHIGSAWRYLGLAWRDAPAVAPANDKPKELGYHVDASGRVIGNMTVKAAVDAMVRRRRNEG